MNGVLMVEHDIGEVLSIIDTDFVETVSTCKGMNAEANTGDLHVRVCCFQTVVQEVDLPDACSIQRSLSIFRKDPGSKVESGVGFV
jgi:hypothetical protein